MCEDTNETGPVSNGGGSMVTRHRKWSSTEQWHLHMSLLGHTELTLVIRDTTLDVPLHHHAHVIMFEHNEMREQSCCHPGTQDFLPEKESEAYCEDDSRECFDNGGL
ncbi:hypothetical protein TNCV_3643461 [Trichonephila clavipes]|nr:hypothetical protein TNCV_3643461 [Trichonephila clavipes]